MSRADMAHVRAWSMTGGHGPCPVGMVHVRRAWSMSGGHGPCPAGMVHVRRAMVHVQVGMVHVRGRAWPMSGGHGPCPGMVHVRRAWSMSDGHGPCPAGMVHVRGRTWPMSGGHGPCPADMAHVRHKTKNRTLRRPPLHRRNWAQNMPPLVTERTETDAGVPASPQVTLGVRYIHVSAISNFQHSIELAPGRPQNTEVQAAVTARSAPSQQKYFISAFQDFPLTNKKGMDLALPISAPVLACPQRVQVHLAQVLYSTSHFLQNLRYDRLQATYYSIASLRSRERLRARNGRAVPDGRERLV